MSAICPKADRSDRKICLKGVEKVFCRWEGASGASYVFSAYDPQSAPHYPHAIYVVGSRSDPAPFLVAITNSLPELLFLGARYRTSVRSEDAVVYVHVPENLAQATSIAADIKANYANVADNELVPENSGPNLSDVARLFLLANSPISQSSARLKLAS